MEKDEEFIVSCYVSFFFFFFFKQKTAYEIYQCDWSSDVCSSDLPILSLTLWSERYSGYELRSVATEVAEELKKDPDTSEITITGGQRRQLRVVLDPSGLKAYNISPLQIFRMLKGANASLPSGMLVTGNKEFVVERSEEHTSELQSH